MTPDIKPRDRDAIIQSLRAGVVPRAGHQHIQVGRAEEVKALIADINRIADGGSAIRFVIGEYGSGKTFFLFLVRAIALQMRIVTAHADLTPDRRLHSTSGQARSLYAELMRNISTRAKPDGGALPTVVERFITSALADAQADGANPEAVIHQRLQQLTEMVGGYDFAQVVAAYWRGHDTGNEALKSDAIRWLRGEFATRTDARAALGVRTIVDDPTVYDHLKLMARFVRLAGFGGLLVCLDELVNLYKLTNTTSRNANYEHLLRLVNDSLQGLSVGLGFCLGGTREFLTDTRRGLYSYPALQSRLAENTFATDGLVDYSGPVIRLPNLTPEDFLVLLTRLRHVYASGDVTRYLVPDDGLHAFMAHCSRRIGDAYFRTPRNTIKAFLDMLAVLEQNPSVGYADLLSGVDVEHDRNPDLVPLSPDRRGKTPSTPGRPNTMTNSPPSSSDPVGQRHSSAFEQLHPSVQHWVWSRGWAQLRDIQEHAVAPILSGEDVIIAAATAAGKTEAAYLPICSALVGEKQDSIAVLNVSPLKALINDQFDRLEALCETLDIPTHRWHGDVPQSRKQQVLRSPAGVLLITPESLEALFITHGPAIHKLFSGLRYVVLDELHVFIGTERGRQLQSLLNRVELTLRRRVPRIGLSATLGDMQLAAQYMRPDSGAGVRAIVSQANEREIKLLLKGYRIREAALGDTGERTEPQGEIAQELYTKLRGQNNLIFANSRSRVEFYADSLRHDCEEKRVPNEFWAHHGNLSKEVREEAEAKLKDPATPCSVVCTNTLELGIDIGHVDTIAQIGSPPSVSSLRQRLGRSGRLEGTASVLRMFVEEPELTPRTPVQDAIRADLVQSVSMVKLLLSRWCEPPVGEALHLSTLVQQTLSVIAQFGAAQPKQLWQALCGAGPFSQVDPPLFTTLLRGLGERDLVTQSQDGSLMLGGRGEKIVNHYSFYAAFATPEEYRVVSATRTLGTMPVDFPLAQDMYIIFAGRRWHVDAVDAEHKVIEVSPAASGRVPLFLGSGGAVHDRVRKEMLATYISHEVPLFLDAAAADLLAEGRREFRRHGLHQRAILPVGKDCILFPWAGDRVMGTLLIQLTGRGLQATMDGVAITLCGCREMELLDHLEALCTAGPADAYTLALAVQCKDSEKYHWCLSDELLSRDYASACLDTQGAWRAAAVCRTRIPLPAAPTE